MVLPYAFFFIYLPAQNQDMRYMRKYSALLLLALFSCYYCGISMFSHVHIINGASVAHSHLGGNSDHNHTDSQYAVIDILSHFQSEVSVCFYCAEAPFFFVSESEAEYHASVHLNQMLSAYSLRGPPQA